MRHQKPSYRVAAVAVAAFLTLAGSATPAIARASGGQTIYSSLVAGSSPGNLPSLGAEAFPFDMLGSEVAFSPGTNRALSTVTVTMSSWACVSGHWYSADCVTPAGATFAQPIQFYIFPAGAVGRLPDGSNQTSIEQTFDIPYRPSASPRCTGGDAGKWYNSKLKKCFNGITYDVTFNFGRAGTPVMLPDIVVYGVTYNTTHQGVEPMSESAPCVTGPGGCPYDSLNVALSQDPTNVTVGSNTTPGTMWISSTDAGAYCDGGTTGAFRLDAPNPLCWGVTAPHETAPFYVPAVQFKAGGRS